MWRRKWLVCQEMSMLKRSVLEAWRFRILIPMIILFLKLIHRWMGINVGCMGPAKVIRLRGENATEDACVAECKSNAQCVAFSGIFGSWCIGCRINLDTLHGPAVVAYSKFIRTKTVGEFVANDESPFENTGYVPLGSSAEELGVRPRFKSSEVNLTTAVVRQNGIALPCEVSVDFIEYEKSDLSFDVFGTLIGDVSCALGKMGNSTFGSSSLRRKLLSNLMTIMLRAKSLLRVQKVSQLQTFRFR